MSSTAENMSRLSAPGGATEQLRRSNLSSILRRVHAAGALPRTELTKHTGLNRSTIGALVAELEKLGLVYESLPTGLNLPGRPSPIVHVDPNVVTAAVNPEVDAITVGLVGLGGRLITKVRIEMPPASTASSVASISSAAIAGLLSGRDALRVVGVGIAVPGQVRLSDGEVRDATHMGWVDEPFTRMMTEATGYRSWAANAANLGMRAESVFGAGKGVDDLVYFIGGPSGIGGGAVTGGQLLVGAAGYAGEFGHSFVRSHGTVCSCGASGCLEAEVTQDKLLRAVGLEPAQADRLAVELARNSDPAVRMLVAEQLELLGIAVRTAVNLFNPRLVILGGFLGDLYEAGGRPGEFLYASAIKSARERIRVERAALGTEQLMIGAGELVFSELFSDPAGFFD